MVVGNPMGDKQLLTSEVHRPTCVVNEVGEGAYLQWGWKRLVEYNMAVYMGKTLHISTKRHRTRGLLPLFSNPEPVLLTGHQQRPSG